MISLVTKVRIDPGACKFVAVVSVEKKNQKEFEINITSECPNQAAFREAIKTVAITDAINRPKANFILQKAAESLPHANCPLAVGIIKACMAEIRFAIKRDIKVEFLTEDKQVKEQN